MRLGPFVADLAALFRPTIEKSKIKVCYRPVKVEILKSYNNVLVHCPFRSRRGTCSIHRPRLNGEDRFQPYWQRVQV